MSEDDERNPPKRLKISQEVEISRWSPFWSIFTGNNYKPRMVISAEAEFFNLVDETLTKVVPNLSWNDVHGLGRERSALNTFSTFHKVVKIPDAQHAASGERASWEGVLLVGPSGTGKTLMGQALAAELNSTSSSCLTLSLTKVPPGCDANMEAFCGHLSERLRFYSPVTLFLDDLGYPYSSTSEERVWYNALKPYIRAELTGSTNLTPEAEGKKVRVIGATNRPWDIDPLILHGFDHVIYVPLPNFIARKVMVDRFIQDNLLSEHFNKLDLVEKLEGYTAPEIKKIYSAAKDIAGLEPVKVIIDRLRYRRFMKRVHNFISPPPPVPLTMNHFKKAIKKHPPNASPDDLKRFNQWITNHRRFLLTSSSTS